VRHADVFCRASDATAVAWSQRGVAGIDGVVAGAAGAAAASKRPTVLVIGDVSALHDLGGFAVASGVKTPLVVVILNNDGGRIFEQLPLADVAAPGDRFVYWTTPHGGGFAGLAQLFRVTYARAESLPLLEHALEGGLSRAGCTVIEVPVPPHGAKDVYRALAERVEVAVQSVVPRI
jgi:2-succinyl-5-enolpyruvyl-6-hydroxy-3-cyclohexene-1-carboxylate synthase